MLYHRTFSLVVRELQRARLIRLPPPLQITISTRLRSLISLPLPIPPNRHRLKLLPQPNRLTLLSFSQLAIPISRIHSFLPHACFTRLRLVKSRTARYRIDSGLEFVIDVSLRL